MHAFTKTTSFILSLFIFLTFSANACGLADGGIIKGHVTDKKTGEPLTGAVISIDGTKNKAISGLDGSFIFRNLPAGDYKITVTMVTYQSVTQNVKVNNGGSTDDIMFSLDVVSRTMEAVVVQGSKPLSGNTDASARQIEKQSDNVLNVLSSRTIQLAPDVTVANVLRRVSGVTVDRGDDGEGRYPVIRGMDKRYNYTLVNGIKIPSPDDKNRYVPMDIFPSEMMQRLEVIKALTPDMEGDAIGGVMNLIMKDAPERLIFQAQGAVGYSQMLFDKQFSSYSHPSANSKSPLEQNGSGYTPTYSDFSKGTLVFNNKKSRPNGQLGLTVGNRFLHNKLGLMFSGSWQSTDRISKETFFLFSPQPHPVTDGSVPEFTDVQLRNYSTHEDRVGLHAKADYRINKNNSISLYSIFMELNSYKSRYFTDSTSTGRMSPGQGLVKYSYYSKSVFQHIYNATLQGKHVIIPNHLVLDWTGAYSIAAQKTPDRSELTLSQNFQPDVNGNIPTPPLYLSGLSKIWQNNSDKDIAGYLNVHYKFGINKNKFDLGIGGMARHKNRDNFYNQYSFTYPSTVYTDVYNIPVTPNKGTPQSPDIYSTVEDISAGYGEIRWQPGLKWNILAGVRIEHTYQEYEQTALPDNASAKNGSTNYYDILPSIHVKYKFTDKSALHISYFQSTTRPGFFEVVPYQIPGEYYTEVGNYNLHHTQAYNFDARYELFPGLADQILVGAFYKTIKNPIEYVYDRPATSNSVIRPGNTSTATNFGGELVFTKYFKKFGISANYTYTYSKVDVSYKYYYRTANTGSDTTVTVTANRPLQGQAAHIGNISLLYKNPKIGSEFQLAAIYTGRHIVYASPYYGKDNATAAGSGFDYWQRGNIIVDISGEQKISKHFAFYFKLTNLLNTPDIIEIMHSSTVLSSYPPFQNRDDRILVNKKYFGQAYLIGFRYHL
jgi:hypothetical protein